MKKILLIIIGTIGGIMLCYFYEFIVYDNYVYKTNSDFLLNNNIVIPKNSYLILHEDMPEGFYRFELCIQLSEKDLNNIEFYNRIKGEWWISYNIDQTRQQKEVGK